ncbi:MAG TPA: TolC family protein [Bryobacteraceae bacterium]|nr:TolC family protein [Bryobacteraceae bacterium]
MHPRLVIVVLLLAFKPGWSASADRGPLRLSLKRAVELALSPEGNTYIQLSDENLRQAKSRTTEARSLLLPDIEAQASQATVMKSLAALGLDLASSQTLLGAADSLTGPLAPTEKELLFNIVDHIPRVVGPFNSVDIRTRLTQSLVDFSNIRRYQSSRAAWRAARSDRGATDNTVSATVAKAYMAALRTDANVEAYQANVSLAEAVLKQAENQKAAGTGTGIEVTRAKVQLSNERQRLLVVQNERTKAHLQLLRVMGLNLATELELTDKLSYEPADVMTLEQAEAMALKNRPDFKAQAEREEAARLNAHAVKLERTPNLVAFADYGTTGTNGSTVSLLPTRDYGFALRVPIFDGGRRDARRAETASQFRQERVRSNDLHEQVELEVRMALDSLHSADEQVRVAEAGLSLAQSELTQARRRYDAGVASSLEVTDAQTRLERARDNRIAALFNHNVARVDLGQATGTIAEVIAHESSGDSGAPVMTPPQSTGPSGTEHPAPTWASIVPPDLAAEVHVETVPAVLAEAGVPPPPAPAIEPRQHLRSASARRPPVRRRTHRRVVRRAAAHRRRRATKTA